MVQLFSRFSLVFLSFWSRFVLLFFSPFSPVFLPKRRKTGEKKLSDRSLKGFQIEKRIRTRRSLSQMDGHLPARGMCRRREAGLSEHPWQWGLWRQVGPGGRRGAGGGLGLLRHFTPPVVGYCHRCHGMLYFDLLPLERRISIIIARQTNYLTITRWAGAVPIWMR